MSVDRWMVKECVGCQRVWPETTVACHRCVTGAGLSEAFEVVRAQAHRTTDPDTSRLAALQAQPRIGSQRARVLDRIRSSGIYGQTAREVEQATGIERAGRRVSELKQGGHIVATGDRREDKRTRAFGEVFVTPDRLGPRRAMQAK